MKVKCINTAVTNPFTLTFGNTLFSGLRMEMADGIAFVSFARLLMRRWR